MSVMRIIVLHPYTKFEVRRPSRSKDMAHFPSQRQAIRKRDSSPVTRCPFVPSRSCTAEEIVILLSQLGSPIILVFFTPSAYTQFQGKPRQRGQNTPRVGKFCNFRLKSPFS